MERLGYGRERDYGDADGYELGDGQEAHGQQQDGHGEEYRDWPDGDPVYEDFNDEDLDDDGFGNDDDEVEDFTGLDEYLAYYAAGAEGQADGLAARFGWRFRARGGRRGKGWTPPNTRDHCTPVFVPVENLQRRDADSPADAPSRPAGENRPA